MNDIVSLDGAWTFRQAGRGERRIRSWLPAAVPGTVHTDLLAAGRIDDPFHRRNELDQRWVEQADWVYRRTLTLPAKFLRDARAVWLDFEGLDTFATVRLNSRKVGTTDNMLRPWRFDVRQKLQPGRNTLEIEFASAVRVAERRAAQADTAFNTVFFPHRMHIRKAQYAGGWDWGPRFMTCGVWRSVRLVAVKAAEIRDLCVEARELTGTRASLGVAIELESHLGTGAELKLELVCRKTGRTVEKSIRTRLQPGTRTVRTTLEVSRPRRWWPAGMGEQNLYDLRTTLVIDGETADRHDLTTGLRTLELVREKDRQGESFRFRVNGKDVFCRGANWIPGDSFLPRFTPRQYRERLTDARDANMNMIRVWGGGIYEDPAFYRACDELGLMVWQDFMFACSEYPEHDAFLENVRAEAEHAVRRLRNHASLAIWCGNNENEWLWERRWPWSPRFVGKPIFYDVLPDVCRKLDPTRPYWPGSPTGGDKPNDPDRGNQHIWSVWAWWEKPHSYRDWPARFVTEFGFQAMPCARTVNGFTNREDRRLISPVLDHHNKMDEGHPRLMKYLAAWLGVPRDLDEYVYLTQVLQIEVVKLGVEHWRRRWPLSAGSIYWQLNDCWPVASWSAIDYHGRPKGLWYASKRFFAPTLVSLRPVGDTPFGLADLEVWISNDHTVRGPATLEITSWSLTGQRLRRRRIETKLPVSRSRRVATMSCSHLRVTDPESQLVHVRLLQGKQLLSENTHCYAPEKHLAFTPPKLRCAMSPEDRNGFKIELVTDRPLRGVALAADRRDGRFDDNFFDLMPDRPKRVRWQGTRARPALAAFRQGLEIRTLASPRG